MTSHYIFQCSSRYVLLFFRVAGSWKGSIYINQIHKLILELTRNDHHGRFEKLSWWTMLEKIKVKLVNGALCGFRKHKKYYRLLVEDCSFNCIKAYLNSIPLWCRVQRNEEHRKIVFISALYWASVLDGRWVK